MAEEQNLVVKTLTIQDVPDELHAGLKERARLNRRSLNQEVIAELASVQGPGSHERLAASRERMRRSTGDCDEGGWSGQCSQSRP